VPEGLIYKFEEDEGILTDHTLHYLNWNKMKEIMHFNSILLHIGRFQCLIFYSKQKHKFLSIVISWIVR
jgi:hypothetical protein